MITEAIVISLIVLCIWYTMQEGEIFSAIGDLLAKSLPAKIHPPAFECNVCMTPWYGSLIYWAFPWSSIGLISADIVAWPIVVLLSMGMNIVINKLETKKDEVVENVKMDNVEIKPPNKTGIEIAQDIIIDLENKKKSLQKKNPKRKK